MTSASDEVQNGSTIENGNRRLQPPIRSVGRGTALRRLLPKMPAAKAAPTCYRRRRMNRRDQPGLFKSEPALPEGFKYRPDFLSPDEERDLARQIETLPFKEFEFQGFLGKRRVVSFGWKYDFNERQL